jgi:hypothetical protein
MAVALMFRLWDMYDQGGISYGRAERAALLECVTGQLVRRPLGRGIDTHVILEEAALRTACEYKAHPEFLSGLRSLCFEHYYWLVFDAMTGWYDQDPTIKVARGEYVSIAERDIFYGIVHLLGVRKGAAIMKGYGFSPSPRELIAEGRERRRGTKIF